MRFVENFCTVKYKTIKTVSKKDKCATYIVKRKSDGKLFFKKVIKGENQIYKE